MFSNVSNVRVSSTTYNTIAVASEKSILMKTVLKLPKRIDLSGSIDGRKHKFTVPFTILRGALVVKML